MRSLAVIAAAEKGFLETKNACYARTVLFCLAAEAIGLNGYYETATPKLMEQLPADVDLVFWSETFYAARVTSF